MSSFSNRHCVNSRRETPHNPTTSTNDGRAPTQWQRRTNSASLGPRRTPAGSVRWQITPLALRTGAATRLLAPPQPRWPRPPLPCALATVASASSLNTSASMMGTPCLWFGRNPHTVSPPSSGLKKCGVCSRRLPPCTTRSPSPPSPAWDSGSMKPSTSRSLTSMASASRSMATGEKGPKTATFPSPKRPSLCYEPTGKPTVTQPGSFPPPGGITNKALWQPLP
jgi:hypothetical protein